MVEGHRIIMVTGIIMHYSANSQLSYKRTFDEHINCFDTHYFDTHCFDTQKVLRKFILVI